MKMASFMGRPLAAGAPFRSQLPFLLWLKRARSDRGEPLSLDSGARVSILFRSSYRGRPMVGPPVLFQGMPPVGERLGLKLWHIRNAAIRTVERACVALTTHLRSRMWVRVRSAVSLRHAIRSAVTAVSTAGSRSSRWKPRKRLRKRRRQRSRLPQSPSNRLVSTRFLQELRPRWPAMS